MSSSSIIEEIVLHLHHPCISCHSFVTIPTFPLRFFTTQNSSPEGASNDLQSSIHLLHHPYISVPSSITNHSFFSFFTKPYFSQFSASTILTT